MISVQTWKSNVAERKVSLQKIRQTLRTAGYLLIVEDVNSKIWDNIPLLRSDNSTKTAQEMSLMRNLIQSRSQRGTSAFSFTTLKEGTGFLIFSVFRNQDQGTLLQVTAISAGRCNDELQSVLKLLSESVALDVPDAIQWVEDKPEPYSVQDTTVRYSNPDFNDEDYALSLLLGDSALRKVLVAVKATGVGMTRRDLERKFPGTDEPLARCIGAGLITSEFVVICKANSEQLNRVPSRQVIELMADNNVRCPRCNRSVRDEHVEEVLTATERTKTLINQSKWMTIRLVKELVDRDIPLSDIAINVTDGPDEIDAFVSLCGKQVMFELKDSQFSMGHAYAFGSRIAISRPSVGIVWALDGVAPEVKSHFEKLKPACPIKYIETLDDLPSILDEILDSLSWELAENAVQTLSALGIFMVDLPGAVLNTLRQVNSTETPKDLAAPTHQPTE